MATSQQLETIAARVLPKMAPGDAVAHTNLFLARVMAAGNEDETQIVLQHFGRDALQEVLKDPPTGIFCRLSWNSWHIFFGMEPTEKPDAFFVIYPWFENRGIKRTQVTAAMIDRMPQYHKMPVYAVGEVPAVGAPG
jgi:hypothetical protein